MRQNRGMEEKHPLPPHRLHTNSASHVPEIKHLDVQHPPQYLHELSRHLDSRADDRQLPHAREALERPDILQEIVVEVQVAQVGRETSELGRQRREPARSEL